MESMIIVNDTSKLEHRTFYYDESLPSLPLPQLEDTITKYLESCKAVLTSEEYERTSKIVRQFLENDGKRLHIQLEKRSRDYKNWLDDWWLDGYLGCRGPAGTLNFSGLPCYSYWPFKDQLKSLALQLHLNMKFWQIIREERVRPQTDAKGNSFNMRQFRYMFNACRIPQAKKDDIIFHFKTKYEGNCPDHIIVFFKKRIYKLHGVSPTTGEIHTPSQFLKMLLEIVKSEEEGPGIACLTELEREVWATARSHLIKLSPVNKEHLKEIETAAFCAAISDEETQDNNDLLRLGMFGTSGFRWMDKFNVICSKNSHIIMNTDHTPLEGMVFVTMIILFDIYLQKIKADGVETIWGDDSALTIKPVELTFVVDNSIKNWIVEAQNVAKKIYDECEALYYNFTKFGKRGIKKLGKIHPCAFIQVCLQYAYMTMHGKPASTYETATTRTYYKGRTETVRTCTSETVNFCKAMINDEPNKKELFLRASKKYHDMVEECKQGKGCDRHLLGLAMTAMENGEKIPEIFTDAAFAKSGGGGNFLLSTSFSGYGTSAGVCLPFREDGYGAFYRINNDSLLFLITSYRTGSYTNPKEFETYLEKALMDCYAVLDNSRL